MNFKLSFLSIIFSENPKTKINILFPKISVANNQMFLLIHWKKVLITVILTVILNNLPLLTKYREGWHLKIIFLQHFEHMIFINCKILFSSCGNFIHTYFLWLWSFIALLDILNFISVKYSYQFFFILIYMSLICTN